MGRQCSAQAMSSALGRSLAPRYPACRSVWQVRDQFGHDCDSRHARAVLWMGSQTTVGCQRVKSLSGSLSTFCRSQGRTAMLKSPSTARACGSTVAWSLMLKPIWQHRGGIRSTLRPDAIGGRVPTVAVARPSGFIPSRVSAMSKHACAVDAWWANARRDRRRASPAVPSAPYCRQHWGKPFFLISIQTTWSSPRCRIPRPFAALPKIGGSVPGDNYDCRSSDDYGCR